MFKRKSPASLSKPSRKRFSPLMLIGVSIPLVLALVAGVVFVYPRLATHAADANPDCSLIVPANPLSAQGLATPYQLIATNQANGPCNEANPAQSAFVQGAVIDPATGQISIYNPLVIDQGTTPAVAPTPPQLPANAVVGLWFGSNGSTLTLRGNLAAGRCVNGTGNGGIFGQFSYCNAPAFFAAANAAIKAGQLKIPVIGTANDGMPCPTTRDFSIVDQDQSDNVTTTYLVTANGQIAQMTAANATAMQTQNAHVQANGSDERLLAVAMDGALGCTPMTAPDLADGNTMVPALPLNELQAAAMQAAPAALVPAGDPMVLTTNGQPDINKLNAYRRGVDQPPAASLNSASTTTYCTNLYNIAPARMQLDAATLKGRPSPDPAAANSLFTFLAQRFSAAFGADNLNCTALINQPNPIALTTDANGVVTDATITVPNGGGMAGNGRLNCVINGSTIIANCNGTATINGQQCTFQLDNLAKRINISCAMPQQPAQP